jgi:hypothetical protein
LPFFETNDTIFVLKVAEQEKTTVISIVNNLLKLIKVCATGQQVEQQK